MNIDALPRAEIDEFLRSQRLARIACQANGQIYVVPIAYVPEEDEGPVRSVLVHSFEGQKVRMMRANPNVCLEVDDIAGMAQWRTVVADGAFEEIRGERLQHEALVRLAAGLLPQGAKDRAEKGDDPFRPPGLDLPAVLFRVRLNDVSGRVATP